MVSTIALQAQVPREFNLESLAGSKSFDAIACRSLIALVAEFKALRSSTVGFHSSWNFSHSSWNSLALLRPRAPRPAAGEGRRVSGSGSFRAGVGLIARPNRAFAKPSWHANDQVSCSAQVVRSAGSKRHPGCRLSFECARSAGLADTRNQSRMNPSFTHLSVGEI